MGQIPLECKICPKQPEFSDVSHLLTHIGSKGHLSNYYKLKIRSTHDRNCLRLIENYDNWYNEWGLEELMSERITLKDKKRSREGYENPYALRSNSRVASNPLPITRPRRVEETVNNPPPTPPSTQVTHQIRGGRHSLGPLDPFLSGGPVKVEGRQSTPVFASPSPRLPSTQPIPLNVSANRRSTLRPRSSLRNQGHVIYDEEEEPLYMDDTDSYYSTPREHCQRHDRREHVDEDDEDDLPPDSDEDREGAAKLKGVYWPGMSIFDSATAINRRRRNQKKDESVIDRLRNNSTRVERIETTLNADWTVNKERDIEWLPSSSPVPESPRQIPDRLADHDLRIGLDRESAIPHDSLAPTPHGQPRYNFRRDARVESLRSGGSDPRSNKRSSSSYRASKSASAGRTRRSVLSHGLEDDDDYVPVFQRSRVTPGAGGQLSFGRTRQRSMLDEDTAQDEVSPFMHSRKNSSQMVADDEAVFRGSGMADPFGMGFGAFGASNNPMINANAAAAIGIGRVGIGTMGRNQGSIGLDNSIDGFTMAPLSAGHMPQFAHRMGLGQYPGQFFGFGMHGFPMAYHTGNIAHGQASPNDVQFSPFGPFAGIGGLWGGVPSVAAQEDALARMNAANEGHLATTLLSNTAIERDNVRSGNIEHAHSHQAEDFNGNDDLPPIKIGSPVNHTSRPGTASGLENPTQGYEFQPPLNLNLGVTPRGSISRPLSAGRVLSEMRGSPPTAGDITVESATNNDDKVSNEHFQQVKGLVVGDTPSENSISRKHSQPIGNSQGHLPGLSTSGKPSKLFQSLHGFLNENTADGFDEERTESGGNSPAQY